MSTQSTIEKLGYLGLYKMAMGTARVRFIPRDGTKPVEIDVEVAITPEEKRRGLMFREYLDDGHGMLFPFDYPSPRSFWMKNVPIPLDMIFVDEDGRIVFIEHEAEPYSETPHGPNIPVAAVIEVPGGFCKRNKIEVGDGLRVVGND